MGHEPTSTKFGRMHDYSLTAAAAFRRNRAGEYRKLLDEEVVH